MRGDENNEDKGKKQKNRKEQMGDTSYSEIVGAKWFCRTFKFSLINM